MPCILYYCSKSFLGDRSNSFGAVHIPYQYSTEFTLFTNTFSCKQYHATQVFHYNNRGFFIEFHRFSYRIWLFSSVIVLAPLKNGQATYRVLREVYILCLWTLLGLLMCPRASIIKLWPKRDIIKLNLWCWWLLDYNIHTCQVSQFRRDPPDFYTNLPLFVNLTISSRF